MSDEKLGAIGKTGLSCNVGFIDPNFTAAQQPPVLKPGPLTIISSGQGVGKSIYSDAFNVHKCTRIISVSASCADCCSVSYQDMEHSGYVPREIGIGGGDYVEFKYCAECGKLQNFKPLSDSNIIEALG